MILISVSWKGQVTWQHDRSSKCQAWVLVSRFKPHPLPYPYATPTFCFMVKLWFLSFCKEHDLKIFTLKAWDYGCSKEVEDERQGRMKEYISVRVMGETRGHTQKGLTKEIN